MILFFGIIVFYIGTVSVASTKYQCVGSAKLKSNPQAVNAKDLPKNLEVSSTTTKLNLSIEKIYCPQSKNDTVKKIGQRFQKMNFLKSTLNNNPA